MKRYVRDYEEPAAEGWWLVLILQNDQSRNGLTWRKWGILLLTITLKFFSGASTTSCNDKCGCPNLDPTEMAHNCSFLRAEALTPRADLCWTVRCVSARQKPLSPSLCGENPFPNPWKQQISAKTLLPLENVPILRGFVFFFFKYMRCNTDPLLKIFPTFQTSSLISRLENRPEWKWPFSGLPSYRTASPRVEVRVVCVPQGGTLRHLRHSSWLLHLFFPSPANNWVFYKRQNSSAENLRRMCLRQVLLRVFLSTVKFFLF